VASGTVPDPAASSAIASDINPDDKTNTHDNKNSFIVPPLGL